MVKNRSNKPLIHRTLAELHLQPPHVHPVDRIINAVAVPVRVATLCAERVQRGEAPGVGVIVAPGEARQAGVRVLPQRQTDKQESATN